MLMNAKTIGSLCITLLFGAFAGAQTAQPPDAPSPQPAANKMSMDELFSRAGLICGAGASVAAATVKPTLQCGVIAGMGPLELEAGVIGPQAVQSSVSGYLSANLWVPLLAESKLMKVHETPLVVGGYTRMFETGHALDYGIGYARAVDSTHSLEFDIRDYWEFSNTHQHNVVFRAAWLVNVPD
jgi:hypothetical protein